MGQRNQEVKSTSRKYGKSTPGNNRGKQGKKDSRDPRINLDNERMSKFVRNMVSDESNDPSWYAKSPEMMSAGNIAFSQVTGLSNSKGVAVPGVCAISYSPTIGGNDNYAVNAAANAKYSFVVHANSRNQSYEAPDLMMMILAGKEVFCAIADLIRAYGIMTLYDQRNAYLPDALLTAMGFNARSLRENYSHMLWDINNLIAQSHQIWIPNDMPLITREFWMNSHIYMDSDSVKGQYYLYTRRVYFKFSPKTSTEGSSLVRVLNTGKDPQNTMSWTAAIGVVQTMIDALVGDQDRGIIFGDILKAYGEDKIYRLNQISADYTVVPVYDREVLTQISNCHIVANWPLSLTQSNGVILENYYLTNGGITPSLNSDLAPTTAMLNLHVKGQPTPEEVMVATRMMCMGNSYVQGTSGGSQVFTAWKPGTVGSELADAFYFLVNINGALTINAYKSMFASTATSSGDILTRLYCYSAFDWAPPIYTLQNTTLPTPTNPDAPIEPYYGICDMENYIWVDTPTMRRMHRTALLSEFGVPINLT